MTKRRIGIPGGIDEWSVPLVRDRIVHGKSLGCLSASVSGEDEEEEELEENSSSRGINETFYSYSVKRLSTMRIVSILPPPVLEVMQKKPGESSWFLFLFSLSVFSPFIFVFNILEYCMGLSLSRMCTTQCPVALLFRLLFYTNA